MFAELCLSTLALPKNSHKELRSGNYHIKLLFTLDWYEKLFIGHPEGNQVLKLQMQTFINQNQNFVQELETDKS